jgi:hypothetical protein
MLFQTLDPIVRLVLVLLCIGLMSLACWEYRRNHRHEKRALLVLVAMALVTLLAVVIFVLAARHTLESRALVMILACLDIELLTFLTISSTTASLLAQSRFLRTTVLVIIILSCIGLVLGFILP